MDTASIATQLEKKPEGRPTVMTEDVVGKLETVFRLGVSDQVACRYAKINRDTYYSHLRKDLIFSDRMAAAKDYGRIAAGSVVMKAIQTNDVKTAKWWLEKRHPDEFKPNLMQVNILNNVIYDEPDWAEDEPEEVKEVVSGSEPITPTSVQ